MLNNEPPAAPHVHNLTGETVAWVDCATLTHCPAMCDCPVDACTATVCEPAPKFVAGWNTPGYLPESDPITFDTAVEACRYLVDTIDWWWDDDYAATDDDEARATIDERWLGVHSVLPYLTPPFAITANGISFWVEPITEGN